MIRKCIQRLMHCSHFLSRFGILLRKQGRWSLQSIIITIHLQAPGRVGAWRSRVARMHGAHEVGGSNPLVPTNKINKL